MTWNSKANCSGSKVTKYQDNWTEGGNLTSQVVDWNKYFELVECVLTMENFMQQVSLDTTKATIHENLSNEEWRT